MIRSDRESGVGAYLPRRIKNLPETAVIPTQPFFDLFGLAAVHVQEHIHFAQIQKIE